MNFSFHIGGLCVLLGVVIGEARFAAGAESVAQSEYSYTEQGWYRIYLQPESGAAPIGKLHNWVLHIESADGEPFVPTQLVINGGMPGHGHGLPSQPKITKYLDDGDFLVEGMKFNMGGVWQLIVGVTGPAGPDRATIEYSVNHPGNENLFGGDTEWTALELGLMQSMVLERIGELRMDRTNRFSGNAEAAQLGARLFFDPGLSASGKVACADCHRPHLKFADDEQFSTGSSKTLRNSPGLLGVAHHKWFYWDGRRDSLWSQAITPLETPGEMDSTRVDVIRYVMGHADYGLMYRSLGGYEPNFDGLRTMPDGAGPFGSAVGKSAWQSMPPADRESANRAFADIGKILAAYVETLQHASSRFDFFVKELASGDNQAASEILDGDEQKGLRLFLDADRTLCLRCHNGPLFTNFGFHNIGTGIDSQGQMDFGRMLGLQAARYNEFNCMGKYSDAPQDTCAELIHAVEEHTDQGGFKVPGLRDVAETGPYMHDGRFSTLRQVIEFYVQGPSPEAGPSEIEPIKLDDEEMDQLVAFLESLSGIE